MPISKKDVNSWEIARLAGVSRSTVSRVVNNYPNVPEKTRKKVMEIVKKYNYYPNISAQVLAGKKTATIGLFWVGAEQFTDDYLSNFFIASIIENAASFGYLILTCVVPNINDQESAGRIKEIFYQGRIDGGIFIGCSNHEPLLEELIGEGYVIGIFDQNNTGRTEPNRVIVNFDGDTAENAVNYLVGLNHRKIGIIHGDLRRYNGIQKFDGFIKGFRLNGIEAVNDWIRYDSFSEKAGYKNMKDILEKSVEYPTAMSCANDSIAFGAINAIKDLGLKVPDDISVIGIDDHMRSAGFNPPLTTFRVDFNKMFSTLTEEVIKVLKHGGGSCVTTRFGSELVERKSCRKLDI